MGAHATACLVSRARRCQAGNQGGGALHAPALQVACNPYATIMQTPSNARPPESTQPQPRFTAELTSEATRPGWLKTTLRLLTLVGAVITALLSASTYVDMLPVKYAAMAGGGTLLLMGLKDGIIAIGDILDNGKRDGSFRLDLLAAFLLPALLFTSCAQEGMTSRQLMLAQAGVSAAKIGLVAAQAQWGSKLADPATPAWQRMAGAMAVAEAQRALDKEQAKLDTIVAQQLLAREGIIAPGAPGVLVQTQAAALTSAKQPVAVWP